MVESQLPVVLRHAFDPDHVVVVGASNRSSNAGLSFVRALRAARFPGRLSVVNRNAERVLRAAGYKHLGDLPTVPDLAILAVPGDLVPQALEEVAAHGIKAVHCFSGGFAERGDPDRVALQHRVANLAREHDIALIGPNCMGIYRPSAGLAFRADQPMLAGNVALVSQSGGVAIAVVHQLAVRGVGISTAVSFGNAAQLGAGRLANAVADAHVPGVVGVYVESANEQDLAEELARVAKTHRVVLFVGPGSGAAHAASARHTATPGGLWRDADEPTPGVTVVDNLEAFVGALEWFSPDPEPGPPPTVAFATISGGIGVLAATQLGRAGVSLAQPSEETRTEIESILPGGLVVGRNPVDLGVSYLSRKVAARTLTALRKDRAVELTIFHMVWDHLVDVDAQSPGYAEGYLELVASHATDRRDLAVYFPRLVEDASEGEARRRLRNRGVRVFETFAEVSAALSTA